jgi:hypothetical protein
MGGIYGYNGICQFTVIKAKPDKINLSGFLGMYYFFFSFSVKYCDTIFSIESLEMG